MSGLLAFSSVFPFFSRNFRLSVGMVVFQALFQKKQGEQGQGPCQSNVPIGHTKFFDAVRAILWLCEAYLVPDCDCAKQTIARVRAPSSTTTPKTGKTQTMVRVSLPKNSDRGSEFLLSLVNTESGVVWVFSDHGLSFLPRGQKHWGRGR